MSASDKIYVELTPEENQAQRELLLRSWMSFIRKNDSTLTERDFFVNEYNLMEVVERVSKRKFYFKVFHGIEHLEEFKELALICYWICKLKPFTVLKTDSELCASCNELFAVHLVLALLERCGEYASAYRRPDNITIKNLIYSLKYQRLCKIVTFLFMYYLNQGHIKAYNPSL